MKGLEKGLIIAGSAGLAMFLFTRMVGTSGCLTAKKGWASCWDTITGMARAEGTGSVPIDGDTCLEDGAVYWIECSQPCTLQYDFKRDGMWYSYFQELNTGWNSVAWVAFPVGVA